MEKYFSFRSEQDERDIVYGNMVFEGRSGSLPSKFKLQTTPIRHQGWLGSCVGQSLAALMECDSMVRYGEDVGHLSPLFIYANAKSRDGNKGQGTSPRVALEQLKKYGVCREELYPYIDNADTRKNVFPTITSEMKADANLRKPTGYATISTIGEIKKAVYYENGCMICIKVFSNLEDTYNGFIKPPKGNASGNHAMSIVGYDDNMEQIIEGKTYKGFFLIKDSYGNDKGRVNGHFYLAYDALKWKGSIYDVDRLINEIWTTYDTTKVVGETYHVDRFNGEVIDVVKREIKMRLGTDVAYVNGVKKKLPSIPTVKNNVTFVPVRFVTENLGARVSYTNEDKRVSVYDSNLKLGIEMFIGDNIATLSNGGKYTMSEPPFIQNGSTLIPLRSVSEMLGYQVGFDSKTKEITIRG